VTLAATIIALPTNATAASRFDYSAVSPESERKKIRRKTKRLRGNSPEVSKRAAERRSFSIYDGQNWLGSVEQRGDAFTAKTIKGKKIGIFANLKLAADAISAKAAA
jgi:hypothetical protein